MKTLELFVDQNYWACVAAGWSLMIVGWAIFHLWIMEKKGHRYPTIRNYENIAR